MSGTRLGDALSFLERQVPLELAEEWDKSGLQVGDPEQPFRHALVALDPTRTAIEEAIRQRADLLVTHHPLLLKPLTRLDLSKPPASLAALLIQNRIALYSAHTNLDRADGGVNDLLAKSLGLKSLRPLTEGEPVFKVVVTVPRGHEHKVGRAMAQAGGGRIGGYGDCAFTVEGIGEFTPGPEAKPFIGEPGKPERVDETRIEMTVHKSAVGFVTDAARAAHPYEEPVIDIYPLEGLSCRGSLGRVGDLPEAISLGDFVRLVTERLGTESVRFVGDTERLVRSVAVCGGSGGALWRTAHSAGADVLVTGDVRYHDAVEVRETGFSIVDAGHGPTEQAALTALASLLTRFAKETDKDIEVSVFVEPDPFGWF